MTDPGTFAAVATALYAGHHVGDYWIQTHHEACHKGDAGWIGRLNCLSHVCTYVGTQCFTLAVTSVMFGIPCTWWVILGLAVSGVTHYTADRREHGLMFWLARRMPWKAPFLKLGVPRTLVGQFEDTDRVGTFMDHVDNPSLGTGAWALDQAWHIFWGVFVAGLVISL